MAFWANEPVERMDRPYGRRWWALAVLCLSLLLAVMANTSLTVAAPDMIDDLALSPTGLQWVIDGYTVPYAALMLVLGAVGDKYSRRGALVAGLLILGAGSLAGALADTSTGVIAARAVMGAGAAMIMPATLSLLAAVFPRSERVTAIILWSATAGVAIALGPLVAGLLLKQYGWASAFAMNIPVAALAVLGAFLLVPPSKAVDYGRIDLVGGALSVLWIGALVYVVIQAAHLGWATPEVVTATVVAVGGCALFIGWELRHPQPVLNVRLFRRRRFTGANLAVVLFFVAVFGAFYFLTQYLQFVLGLTPLETGVRMVPLALAVFAGSALTGVLTRRFGMRVTVTAGMLGGTAALLLFARVDGSSGYADLVLPLILLGLANGLALSPCTEAIMGEFPESELGIGGAVNDTSLELGGSLGIAVLGSVLAGSYTDRLRETVGDRAPAEALAAAEESVGAGLAVAAETARHAGPEAGRNMLAAVTDSFADAVARTGLVGAVILGVGTILVAVVLPGRKRNPDVPAAPAASGIPAAPVREPVSARR
ncbi:MFS transporter [Streptomyces sp. NPDC020875]|uniref:MFS transporter n=1 Tax=Streptomyces sp. NPDC020875 TaxID=3154898 RepID=UPI00340413EE